ncbi:MAG: cytochrome c biogenesis heme-transporting ATPase CcmA [Enterobacterales bacterium]|nr:cytochrome c biogenesis heme-transporting ATPase CcmA [Enterobacterales bacterium]
MSKHAIEHLELKNLTVIRSDLPLFKPVDISLKPSQAIQISGTNGAGKTSLLRCICGLSQRYEGSINWAGQSIENCKPLLYQELLYIGHSLGLKPKLTVEQNLSFYQQLRSNYHRQNIIDALEQLEIGAYFDEYVGNLSAGQKRRVALARILVEPVNFWVLDEPMVALDVNGQAWLEKACNSHLAEGGMILLTSHQRITGIHGLSEYRLQEPSLTSELFKMQESA